MKNFAIKLVWFTTIYVFVFAGLCQTNIFLPVIMSLYCIGVVLILFMVYTVLHDDYKTSRTFKDWYGDHPMETLEEEDQ
ncbi:hypothetical protein [Flavobacterium gawalongense]|uniref:Uncharacterized protein n=1 Tax=Flavobacterium gawalongense TaxID=2594432 RepID=A0A553BJ78_9FLAO|nr:hypothetical protein [Flavobacterium gawalongense]TRX03948.1 hypothetical protein FNW33_02470 [Flavobacterium gawalongense]TRX07125.1 hypothetical protein FNW12_06880 [Flavobacterium gawalongense]TRX08306.1 hypothetical protein FNW11_11505 [Flavobacterium gawalongense]TRX09014.1 hypothetical protein FNW10_11895 [Flavobacterium gawalongense]TRX25294.1 hypothetical protein FNW38_11675 [Flavobacterium gawalongense]